MINITKPFVPPLEEYSDLLKKIWEREWFTNNGPLVNELELKLKEELGVSHLLFVGNGTIALQLAIKALDLKGEIITTPFSYVATTSSLVWENCTPVFVDIETDSFTIDASKIEASITDKTSAILATHVYGLPCDVVGIQKIADKHNLKVIYDAAHAFGTEYLGKSLVEYGDISTLSFHATKLYHTVEGGGVVSSKLDLIEKLSYMRNFGHNGPEKFHGVGINGKNSEVHAAMGLVNLKYIDKIIEKRKLDSDFYDSLLSCEFEKIRRPKIADGVKYNYSYYPVLFPTEGMLLKVKEELEKNSIYSRRYFYPSLNKLSYVPQKELVISEDLSSRVLCLPLYYDITKEEIELICKLVLGIVKN